MKNYATLATENERVIKDLYSAFQASNLEGVISCLAPDVILHVPGTGLNAGEYWGHAGFRRFYSNIMNYYGGHFRNKIIAFAAGDQHVFVREFNVLNRKSDPSIKWHLPMVMMYTLRNGKVSEMRVVPEFLDEYNAYWTPSVVTIVEHSSILAENPGRSQKAFSMKHYDFILEKYNQFWAGDYTGFGQIMSTETVFFLAGNSVLAGSYKGFEGYLNFRNNLLNVTGDKYQLRIAALAASDTDIFVLEDIYQNTIHQEQPGHVYVLMHFIVDDGELVRANDFPLDAAAYEKFYGRGQQDKTIHEIAAEYYSKTFKSQGNGTIAA